VIDVIFAISLYYIALGRVKGEIFPVLSVSHAGWVTLFREAIYSISGAEVALFRVAKYCISSGVIRYFGCVH